MKKLDIPIPKKFTACCNDMSEECFSDRRKCVIEMVARCNPEEPGKNLNGTEVEETLMQIEKYSHKLRVTVRVLYQMLSSFF